MNYSHSNLYAYDAIRNDTGWTNVCDSSNRNCVISGVKVLEAEMLLSMNAFMATFKMVAVTKIVQESVAFSFQYISRGISSNKDCIRHEEDASIKGNHATNVSSGGIFYFSGVGSVNTFMLVLEATVPNTCIGDGNSYDDSMSNNCN